MTRAAAVAYPRPDDLPPPATPHSSNPAPFPVDVFPPSVRSFIEAAERALPAPRDFIAAPVLIAAGAAIGHARVAQHKASHVEHAALWLAIVGDPGLKKTPGLRVVMSPLWERDHEEHVEWQAARAALEAADEADRRPPPPRLHYVLTDATTEAVAEVLDANPRGFALHLDELAGWMRGMDQYKAGGKGSDRQQWLSIWSGVPITVKRKGRDPLHSPRPFVAILGGIQPGVLHELSTGRADGFLDRMLFAYPAAEPFQLSRDELSTKVQAGWERVVRSLYSLEADDERNPVPLPLTPDAHEAYYACIEELYTEARNGMIPEHLAGVVSKAEGMTRVRQLVSTRKCRFGVGDDGTAREPRSGFVSTRFGWLWGIHLSGPNV